jgi:methylenetetrahydrofolate dehydrogenase (NADP+)/methenyltetrahydrofolate cyclohydrolase
MIQNQTGSRAQLLDGRQVADRILSNLSDEVSQHVHRGGLAPGLAVILVGDDPASQVYVSHKVRACEKIGIHSMAHHLPNNVSENELLSLIDDLNADDSVHGILVQLPLPSPLDGLRVTRRILPQKDVDGFHPVNMGLLAQRTPQIRPCTPRGVLALLEAYEINPKYQHAVVVGASNIVGRPLMLELLLAGATVTITHRFTADLEAHVRRADILCVAVGKPDLVEPDWIKPGAVVIDIGISRLPNGQIRGDLDFERASTKASWITPVPGGVGPMTVAMLMQNTVEAAGLLSASSGKTP